MMVDEVLRHLVAAASGGVHTSIVPTVASQPRQWAVFLDAIEGR